MNTFTLPGGAPWRHWLGSAGKVLALVSLLGALVPAAQAVPSYARQTGSDCASCHVGSFGPQLTPYGIKFKLGGYTDSDGQAGKVPLSAMAVATWTKTSKGLPDQDRVDTNLSANSNVKLDEASIFLAGRLSDSIGTFVQSTYDGVEKKSSLDQLDIRYATNLNLAGKEAILGVSINNNPTLTDPFNTLAQWRFPYVKSYVSDRLGVGPSPLMENLAGSVVGANAYGFWDSSLYGELGVYNSLSHTAVNMVNGPDQGKFKGVGTYWRAAYFKDRKRDNFSLGIFGFNVGNQPDRSVLGTADHYRDLGIDAAYQFLGNRQHIFTVNASYVKEWQKLNFTNANAGSDNLKNTIDQFRLAASYHYNQTWGVSAGLFDSRGKADATYYPDSLNGRPNTAGYTLQADWTPWGKESSWGTPWANLRVGTQYNGYKRYMGGKDYIDADGNNRRASDNNTLTFFIWTAI